MADHSKPTTTSTYVNFVSELDGRLDDISLGLDPATTSPTNLATNAIRWTSASNKWQKYNGTTWADLSSAYSININGTVGATTPASGAFTTLSATGNVTLGDASGDTVTINGTVGAGVVISGSTATDALRITQTGAGNALVVEDSTNPDSTPFVIDGSGRTVVGYTSALFVGDYINTSRTPTLQVQGLGGSPSAAYLGSWSNNDSQPSQLIFGKSKSGTVGTNGIVASGTDIGAVVFSADDGATLIPAASILGEVDGTPGTNDMPGRLVFSTTADGASSPSERMRIRSDGGVGIGGTGNSSVGLYLQKNITGATTSYGLLAIGSVQNDVTSAAYNFLSQSYIASGTAVTTYAHFRATEGTISGSMATQYGFMSVSDIISGTTNVGFYAGNTAAVGAGKTAYGFYSAVNTATGGGTTYGFYAAGTAPNVFLGKTGIGSTSSPAVTLAVTGTDAILVPVGTTAQRPTGATGYIRYNTSTSSFEGHNGTAWGNIGGGATGGGTDTVFYLNSKTVSTTYSIPSGQNASCVGPITVSSGATVTVPSGSRWVVL